MTVKELIEQLKQCDPNDIVILSSDAEGNNHSPLDEVSEARYVPDSTWSGDVVLRQKKLTGALKSLGYQEEDIYQGDDAVNCIVLHPVN